MSMNKVAIFYPSYKGKGQINMSQKREKGFSQKGKTTSGTTRPVMAAEEMEKANHPTKRQNAKQ